MVESANDHWDLPSAATEPVPFPATGEQEQALKMIRPIAGEPLHFRTEGFMPKEVRLVPFFEILFQRYAIYWRLGE